MSCLLASHLKFNGKPFVNISLEISHMELLFFTSLLDQDFPLLLNDCEVKKACLRLLNLGSLRTPLAIMGRLWNIIRASWSETIFISIFVLKKSTKERLTVTPVGQHLFSCRLQTGWILYIFAKSCSSKIKCTFWKQLRKVFLICLTFDLFDKILDLLNPSPVE